MQRSKDLTSRFMRFPPLLSSWLENMMDLFDTLHLTSLADFSMSYAFRVSRHIISVCFSTVTMS